MPRIYKKKSKPYSPLDLHEAVKKVIENESSLTESAIQYNIKRSTLYDHVKRAKNNIDYKNFRGSRRWVSDDVEKQLVHHFKILEKKGIILSLKDVRKSVKVYLDKNEVKTQFIKRNNWPGLEWCSSFLKRYNISWNSKKWNTSTKRNSKESVNLHTVVIPHTVFSSKVLLSLPFETEALLSPPFETETLPSPPFKTEALPSPPFETETLPSSPFETSSLSIPLRDKPSIPEPYKSAIILPASLNEKDIEKFSSYTNAEIAAMLHYLVEKRTNKTIKVLFVPR